jgi:hypothetical protein
MDFCFDFAPVVYREMKHVEKLEAWPVWQLLTIAHEKYQVVEIMFLLAVAQNICILLRFSSLQWNVDFFQYIFGLCQICCSGTVFARHAIHQSFKGISVSLFTNDPQLVFLTIASCFSFLGLFWSPLFFSFHLLDIANKSPVLQNVFLAVTTNLDSLLLTALFTLIVIWIYAVYGFATYSDYFRAFDDPTDADGGEAVMDLCTDIYVCYLNAVSTGLRSGDLGGLMQMVPSEDAHFQGMMFYQFSYWVIIITVMLNLIFGIIIDTVRAPWERTRVLPTLRAAYPMRAPQLTERAVVLCARACAVLRAAYDARVQQGADGEHVLHLGHRPLHSGHEGRRLRAAHQTRPKHVDVPVHAVLLVGQGGDRVQRLGAVGSRPAGQEGGRLPAA